MQKLVVKDNLSSCKTASIRCNRKSPTAKTHMAASGLDHLHPDKVAVLAGLRRVEKADRLVELRKADNLLAIDAASLLDSNISRAAKHVLLPNCFPSTITYSSRHGAFLLSVVREISSSGSYCGWRRAEERDIPTRKRFGRQLVRSVPMSRVTAQRTRPQEVVPMLMRVWYRWLVDATCATLSKPAVVRAASG